MKTAIKNYFASLATMRSLRAKPSSEPLAVEMLRLEIGKLQCQPGDAIVLRTDRILNAHQAQQIRAMVEPVKPAGVTVLVLSGLSIEVLTQGPGAGQKSGA